jgi:hypothetical protein
MATWTKITKVGTNDWLFEFAAGANQQVIDRGIVLRDLESDETEYRVSNSDADEPPPLELFNTSTGDITTTSLNHSPRATLQWRGLTTARRYKVQQYVDAAWTTIGHQFETGCGYYHWLTDPLADATTHQFRVVIVDERGYEGDPIPFDFFMCCHPASPDIVMTYDSGTGDVTVAADT